MLQCGWGDAVCRTQRGRMSAVGLSRSGTLKLRLTKSGSTTDSMVTDLPAAPTCKNVSKPCSESSTRAAAAVGPLYVMLSLGVAETVTVLHSSLLQLNFNRVIPMTTVAILDRSWQKTRRASWQKSAIASIGRSVRPRLRCCW